MTGPRLLDLFCGAGGAARGYQLAGFHVTGVDIAPQPNYCGDEFVQGDALDYLAQHWHPLYPFDAFDAIHASPPCQAYSVLRHAAQKPKASYPDLIAPTRDLLVATGLPYVIENVPTSPTAASVVLCGSMFGLGAYCAGDDKHRQLRRHRRFESNVPMMSAPCHHEGDAIGVYGGGRTARFAFGNGAHRDRYHRRGAYQGTAAEAREAMGIDWMRHGELTQAIPPAYTEHIGGYLMTAVKRGAVSGVP